MSRTEMNNGERVERAVREVAYGKLAPFYGMFTIGEVSRMAKMSKPTVKKYVEKLREFGTVNEIERDMRYCTKLTTRSFLYTGAKVDD